MLKETPKMRSTMNVIFPLFLLILDKSGEIVLGILLAKFWKWVLRDAHFQSTARFLKLQILVLYLDWVLQKTSPNYPPNLPERKTPPTRR